MDLYSRTTRRAAAEPSRRYKGVFSNAPHLFHLDHEATRIRQEMVEIAQARVERAAARPFGGAAFVRVGRLVRGAAAAARRALATGSPRRHARVAASNDTARDWRILTLGV